MKPKDQKNSKKISKIKNKNYIKKQKKYSLFQIEKNI